MAKTLTKAEVAAQIKDYRTNYNTYSAAIVAYEQAMAKVEKALAEHYGIKHITEVRKAFYAAGNKALENDNYIDKVVKQPDYLAVDSEAVKAAFPRSWQTKYSMLKKGSIKIKTQLKED